MSGSKQHFIPQSLLKSFGTAKGAKTQVVVYGFERGIFTAATDGIGAERHFYSELGVEGGEDTLDDRITDYEQSFPKILAALRGAADGAAVDTPTAAEFVTHLAVRNDHFRKSAATGGAKLIEGMSDALADEDRAKAILGVAGDEPSEMFAGELAKLWQQYGPIFQTLDMTEAQFNALAFSAVKENFSGFHGQMAEPLAAAFKDMLPKLPEVAATAQKRSLDAGLSPPLRVEKMSELDWHVERRAAALILPDCVAIAIDAAGETLPLMFADFNTIATIFMPLSSDRLLVGSKGAARAPLPDLNPLGARCSWDFFVASERTPELDALRPLLRTRVTAYLGDTVTEVLDEAAGASADTGRP